MKRSFKYPVAATSRQSALATQMLADHCDLYNAALQERRDAYKTRGISVSYGTQSEQLKDVRRFDAEGQGRWSFSSQQQTLRRLNKSFQSFFNRVKKGEKAGYPRFRSANRFNTVDFVNGDGARWDSQPKNATSTWTHVYLQGIGHVKVNMHRPVEGRVKQVILKREGTRRKPKWFVIVACDDVPEQPLPETGRSVGIDLATGGNGLAYLATLNRLTGEIAESHLEGVRAYHRVQKKLAAAQQEADRTKPKSFQRSSARHKRNLDRVRLLHAKTARIRADYLHKAARQIINNHDTVAVEAMPTANMTRRTKAKPDTQTPNAFLRNGQAAKTGLNKSILDSAWATFLALIDAKAECAGRRVVRVNPAGTSQTCSVCGHRDPEARDGKTYTCVNPDCGWIGDADWNAARNILRAGLALLEAA